MTHSFQDRAAATNARTNAAMTPKERRASDKIVARLAEQKRAALILNSAQAEAIYSAMCALNNVCGRIACDIGCVRVTQREDDVVMITVTPSGEEERYAGQHEFAIAYRVDGSAAMLADALAAPAGPIPAGMLDAAD